MDKDKYIIKIGKMYVKYFNFGNQDQQLSIEFTNDIDNAKIFRKASIYFVRDNLLDMFDITNQLLIEKVEVGENNG